MATDKWSSEIYSHNASFVPALGAGAVELLDPQTGERILDLGCGDGVLTMRLLEAGADVVGVDASENLIEAAKRLGIDARVLDAHSLPFEAEFDAVFSNAALHWMLEPNAVVRGVAKSLKPGGRFVGEMGGHGNVAAVRSAIHALIRFKNHQETITDPWYFPTATEYGALLESEGFIVEQIGTFARPTPLPTGIRGWLKTFAAPFFTSRNAWSEDEYAEIETLLTPILCDESGNWHADYVRLRFLAKKAT